MNIFNFEIILKNVLHYHKTGRLITATLKFFLTTDAIMFKQTNIFHMDYKIFTDTLSLTWGSENNLWVPVLLFYESRWLSATLSGLFGKHPYQLSHLTSCIELLNPFGVGLYLMLAQLHFLQVDIQLAK